MKRQLIAALLLAAPALPLQADALGAKISVNAWNQSFDARARKGGEYIDIDSAFNLGDETDYQVLFTFEHPIPLIPNLLIQHTEASTRGHGMFVATIFDKIEFEGEVVGELDLTHTDVGGYYEILDNWINLDVGLNIRVFDANVTLINEDGDRGELVIDDIVPLLYVATRFDLPFTGWYLQADGNYISWEDDKVLDLRAALGWEIFAGLGLELGYRHMDVDYGVSGGQLESTTKGIYGGVFWDF